MPSRAEQGAIDGNSNDGTLVVDPGGEGLVDTEEIQRGYLSVVVS